MGWHLGVGDPAGWGAGEAVVEVGRGVVVEEVDLAVLVEIEPGFVGGVGHRDAAAGEEVGGQDAEDLRRVGGIDEAVAVYVFVVAVELLAKIPGRGSHFILCATACPRTAGRCD